MLAAHLLLVTTLSLGATDDAAAADERQLREAGVGTDGPALLDFFRRRTLTDADRAAVARLVMQLGDEDGDRRDEASSRLIAFGPPVLPALRNALNSEDPEVVRRAREAIGAIEQAIRAGLSSAAARELARKAPAGATPVLLAYLPFAEEAAEDDLLTALVTLNPSTDKLHPGLTPALSDPHALVRAAAAHVIGRKGEAKERAAVRKLLADKEPSVRFRAAVALLTARDRSAVPVLIELMAGDGPVSWQSEDALFRLAGDKAPTTSAERARGHEAWVAWWKANADTVDLARFTDAELLLGLTLGIEFNTGRVWECGPDGKLRWEISGLKGPMEAQVLPGNRVLIVESSGANLLTERDFQGNIISQTKLSVAPNGVQRLPNGHTFVSSTLAVLELDRDGKELYHTAVSPSSNAIRKLRNGNIAYTGMGEIVEMKTSGEKVRSIPLPNRSGRWVGLHELPGDRFVAADSAGGNIVEVDATGKVLWEGKVAGSCGIAKLPNGHFLVGGPGKVTEVGGDGKEVWSLTTPGYVRRIHRR
jgi:hypothetical protein